MSFLLSPRAWAAIMLAVALGATHLAAFKAGKAVVTEVLLQERLELANATVAAAERSLLDLQESNRKVQDVQTKLAVEKKRAAADAAAATDQLRLLEAALEAARKGDPSAAPGTHGAAASELLGSCAQRYTGLAQETDTAVTRLTALQSYVTGVCK